MLETQSDIEIRPASGEKVIIEPRSARRKRRKNLTNRLKKLRDLRGLRGESAIYGGLSPTWADEKYWPIPLIKTVIIHGHRDA